MMRTALGEALRKAFPQGDWARRSARCMGLEEQTIYAISCGQRRITRQDQLRLLEWLDRAPIEYREWLDREGARALADLAEARRIIEAYEPKRGVGVNSRVKVKRAGRPRKAKRRARVVPPLEWLKPGEEGS